MNRLCLVTFFVLSSSHYTSTNAQIDAVDLAVNQIENGNVMFSSNIDPDELADGAVIAVVDSRNSEAEPVLVRLAQMVGEVGAKIVVTGRSAKYPCGQGQVKFRCVFKRAEDVRDPRQVAGWDLIVSGTGHKLYRRPGYFCSMGSQARYQCYSE